LPKACAEDGYELIVSETEPAAGKQCAILRRHGTTDPQLFGNVLQALDPAPYRSKRVRLRAAVRTEVTGPGNHAQLWLRVDRPESAIGFLDNMDERPIVTAAWQHFEIVGDVAEDATGIVFGMMLIGSGEAALDDVSVEVVGKDVPLTNRPEPAPGLMEVRMAATVQATMPVAEVTFLHPLPLAYGQQAPLTFQLTVEPPECAASVAVVAGAGDNRVLRLTLRRLDEHQEVKVAYRAAVLVAPTTFDAVPATARFPSRWPDAAKAWLESTWCCERANDRIKQVAIEIRGDSDDVMAVISGTLARAREVFAAAKGRVTNLTALEALDKEGSCTSCANLVAALLRGAGVPARILSGYPTWSGPLQTHYTIEAFVPDHGWYPIELTLCRAPWPNHKQVHVCNVPIEHESRELAGRRHWAAGAVPYLSLRELEDQAAPVSSVGTLKPYCDHVCRMVQPLAADPAEWAAALAWTRTRWEAWLAAPIEVVDGRVNFGPDVEAIAATTVADLRRALE